MVVVVVVEEEYSHVTPHFKKLTHILLPYQNFSFLVFVKIIFVILAYLLSHVNFKIGLFKLMKNSIENKNCTEFAY